MIFYRKTVDWMRIDSFFEEPLYNTPKIIIIFNVQTVYDILPKAYIITK